jgi:glycosyltransferase involved in cell wall biosynthesis
MRVLHLDSGREMRGGQWQVLRLIEGLAAGGVESTLLARRNAPLFEAASKRGWRVKPLEWSTAWRQARAHDLAHAHDARCHTVGAMVRGAPLVVSRRVAFGPAGHGPAQLVSQWKYRRAARFIAVSEFVKSILIGRGVEADRISVVYDGVPVLDPVVPAGDRLRLLAPANAGDPRKGASLALQAAELAGVQLEFSNDLEHDLAHATLLLYVTHSEGLGSAALLAMSAGVPVVASRVGGLPEAIRHGENGILVDNQPAAIAAAIRHLLDNPALARRLGNAGRQTVLQNFTVNHMVRRTIEVYRQVLQ